MNIRNLGWVLGAACLSIGGVCAISACSSSTTPPAAGDPVDSGGQSQADTGSSAMDSGSGGNLDAGQANECGSTPKLHPGDGGSLYCPFGPDGAVDCPTASTVCCIGGEISRGNYAVSQCGSPSEICPNPLPDAGMYPARRVECEEAVDCHGGEGGAQICCGTGGTPAAVAACGYYQESPGFTATTCVSGATCPAGQFQMCAGNDECGGKTCVPFKALGIQLGFCQ